MIAASFPTATAGAQPTGDRSDGHPLLERLTPTIPEIAAEYWIIVHRDLRRSACVRAVIDWVKAVFAEQRDVLAGAA